MCAGVHPSDLTLRASPPEGGVAGSQARMKGATCQQPPDRLGQSHRSRSSYLRQSRRSPPPDPQESAPPPAQSLPWRLSVVEERPTRRRHGAAPRQSVARPCFAPGPHQDVHLPPRALPPPALPSLALPPPAYSPPLPPAAQLRSSLPPPPLQPPPPPPPAALPRAASGHAYQLASLPWRPCAAAQPADHAACAPP